MESTIVVPLDGSEMSERALPYARGFAQRAGTTFLFVSAVEIPVEFTPMPVAGAALGGEIDEWSTERRQYLETVAATFGNIAAHYVVSIGAPADVIVEAIEKTNNPVLVMASHGRSGLSRLFAGSVASKVLGDVHCPVLLIRAHLPAPPADQTVAFNKALVPLDGSKFGEHAFNEALGAIDHPDLAIHLLRVVDVPAMTMASAGDASMGMNYGLVSEYLDATQAEAKEYLTKLAESFTAKGRTVTWEIRDGDVTHVIVEVADAQNADLIAMSTHGRGGLGRLIFGSVAEKVLHSSNHPLLLIRPKDDDDDD